MIVAETNTEINADGLKVGDKLYDRLMGGAHGQRVEIEWVGIHSRRNRVYIAGVEENSRNPVQLAYDAVAKVKVWREPEQ